MKKLIVSASFLFVVFAVLTGRIFGQEIPGGAWGFEPSKLY